MGSTLLEWYRLLLGCGAEPKAVHVRTGRRDARPQTTMWGEPLWR